MTAPEIDYEGFGSGLVHLFGQSLISDMFVEFKRVDEMCGDQYLRYYGVSLVVITKNNENDYYDALVLHSKSLDERNCIENNNKKMLTFQLSIKLKSICVITSNF